MRLSSALSRASRSSSRFVRPGTSSSFARCSTGRTRAWRSTLACTSGRCSRCSCTSGAIGGGWSERPAPTCGPRAAPCEPVAGCGGLLGLIALGSIPAAVVGLLFNDWIEEEVRQPWLVAIDAGGRRRWSCCWRTERPQGARSDRLDWRAGCACSSGLAQSVALIPGVSRSGADHTRACSGQFTRDDAARFAFLLGTPAFVGAAILESKDRTWLERASGRTLAMLVGFVVRRRRLCSSSTSSCGSCGPGR